MAWILACEIGRAKKVAVSESRELALGPYLGQVTNIGKVARENYKRSALGRVGILVFVIGRSKKVAVSELRVIARVACLVQITNIGNGRARILKKGRFRQGCDISMCDWEREKGCRLGIARNRTSSIFMPNNEYWKRSRAKIINGALLGGMGY